MVIGGETVVSRENEHSTSVEVLGPNGLCKDGGIPDLPEKRGKLSVVYDPAGAVIACGGGERIWEPSANCWQLLADATDRWVELPPIYPVHGAATTFFKGKFWVLGGSTGDDSRRETITDKARIVLSLFTIGLAKGHFN